MSLFPGFVCGSTSPPSRPHQTSPFKSPSCTALGDGSADVEMMKVGADGGWLDGGVKRGMIDSGLTRGSMEAGGMMTG